MANLPWLDEVLNQLVKRGLPPSYVERFAGELSDHLDDFKEENMEADVSSRLGEPEQVVEAAAMAYRRRSFLGRHPTMALLVFAISPVMAQYILFVAVLAISVGSGATNWHENHWIFSLIIAVCSTFLSILYCELAMRLGIGRKWMFASCTALGGVAMFLEFAFSACTVTVLLPVQLATPLAVGWWFIKRTYNHEYTATKVLVFAISPVVSLMVLWFMLFWPILMILQLLMALAVRPLVAVGVAPAALANGSLAILLLMLVIPTAVASLLYCKITKWSGSGMRWMFISCVMLAVCAATASLQFATILSVQFSLSIGLRVCISLTQFLMPVAIGWWFMRRTLDSSPMQRGAPA